MHIGLMAGVEDDRIVWRVEYPMQCQRQLDDAEVRYQMPTGCGHLVNEKLANLVGQILQVRLGKVLQIGGPTDLFKHPVSVRTATRPPRRPAQIPRRLLTSSIKVARSAAQLSLLSYAPVSREAWSA